MPYGCFFLAGNGGGGGGCIAIYINEKYHFKGTVQALGKGGAWPGSPGTVYIQTNVGSETYSQLHLDGSGYTMTAGDVYLTCHYPAILDETVYVFDEVFLWRQACTWISSVS